MHSNQSDSIFSRILEASLAVGDRLSNDKRPGYRLSEFLRLSQVFEDFSVDNDVSHLLRDLKSPTKTVISINLDESDSNALAFGLLYAEKVIVTLPRLGFDNIWDVDEGVDQPHWQGFRGFSSFCMKYKNLIEDGLLLPIPSSVHVFDNNNQCQINSSPERCTRDVSDLTVSAKEVIRPIDSFQPVKSSFLPFASILNLSQEPYEYILELREKHKQSFDLYTQVVKILYQSSSEQDAIATLTQIDEQAKEITAIVAKYIRDQRFKGADIAGNVLVASLLFNSNLPYAPFLSIAFSGGNLGSKLLDIVKTKIEFTETIKTSPYYYAYAGHKHLASHVDQ
ncbi:hypothetical protein [cf. Phormidesmis sp. LEGE 11477]|uniref:hypothetical protein n=1 Tax=cf. Phormidesmis sp. LEGE 11477 TaxID=1828680 RepID=UPI001880B9A1|nr:hypothetical protein [cf. Phormidesmis sp. LEGE 11477]MBE9064107.1 hypothetical protein [cf. Phormidesmis sp. LEGE 11477]